MAEVVEEEDSSSDPDSRNRPGAGRSSKRPGAGVPASSTPPGNVATDPLAPERKKRRKKRRRKSIANELRGILWAMAVLGALWLLLTPLAFFRYEGVYALLGLGAVTLFCGKRWFLNIAAEDGLGVRLACAFIPFYSAFFFFTNLRRTVRPFAISCCGGTLLITGMLFCYVHKFRDAGEDRTATAPTSDTDAECEKLLAKANKAEARAWLTAENTRRGIFKWSRKEALRVVEELYRLGAKDVLVVEITSEPEFGELAAEFVVVMPEDREARKKLFQWHASFREEEAEKDRGQKYLLVDLD